MDSENKVANTRRNLRWTQWLRGGKVIVVTIRPLLTVI